MVGILPQTQRRKDSIALLYRAVTIAAIHWFIELSKSEEAIILLARWRIGLRCEVPEQFLTIVYGAVAIAVKCKPSVVRTSRRPREPFPKPAAT